MSPAGTSGSRPLARPEPSPSPNPLKAPSPPPRTAVRRANPYKRAHVPVPLKAQTLDTIAEQDSRSSSTRSSSLHSSRKASGGSSSSRRASRGSGGDRERKSGSSAASGALYAIVESRHFDQSPSDREEEEERLSLLREQSKHRSSRTDTASYVIGSAMAVSVQDPQTQLNFNATLKKLWRRVETMKRTNRLAAAHHRARHIWLSFVPTSTSAFLAVFLSAATGFVSPGPLRLALSLATGFCAACAFFLNFKQGRWEWSGRALVHQSAAVELSQVAFRLETLRKYEGKGLTEGSHSSRERANAVRDLYRIDVYLQAMERCTPRIPDDIHEFYTLLASRLKEICTKYPNAVKARSAYPLYVEEPSPKNPVPVEMQIDAFDLLGREIRNYSWYPLLLPDAQVVVSRTVNIFFEKTKDESPRDKGNAADLRDQIL